MPAKFAGDSLKWDDAPDDVREKWALTRLFWFYRMVATGGPDGSELDEAVYQEAKEAADWYSPRLQGQAREAGW